MTTFLKSSSGLIFRFADEEAEVALPYLEPFGWTLTATPEDFVPQSEVTIDLGECGVEAFAE